jgi:hypothetical protein
MQLPQDFREFDRAFSYPSDPDSLPMVAKVPSK